MLILDFYVDEPACFGVPPYLSPYCRYAAGALVDAGVAPEQISFLTVDQWRADNKELKDEPELVLLVAGATVPGKYLGGKIGSVSEILEFLEFRQKYQPGTVTLIGGPIRYCEPEIRHKIDELGGILIRGDLEVYAERFAAFPGGPAKAAAHMREKEKLVTGARRTYEQVDRWATRGAFLTEIHPNYPYLILELETYRGCTREIFCSFCTEAFYGKPVFRQTPGILDEVEELYRLGNKYFRLGRQADLMTYLPDMNDFQNSFPRPVPASLETLYSGIRARAPDLKLLHLDNINPGLIATFPEESREIVRIICEYNTAGDTAAMGLETVDPNVIAINDLKCNADEARRAIEIVNEFGATRKDGIPALLPGVNLLHGLPGESDKTFEQNYHFLKGLLDEGLLLRRINIRQTVTYNNTKLDLIKDKEDILKSIPRKRRRPEAIEQKFLYFREKIRQDIDKPMLRLNFPPGCIIREVIIEGKNQGYYLGRALGSYPITVKIPDSDPGAREVYAKNRPLDIIVTGAEERSLTGLSYPISFNDLSRKALQSIPGIGKKVAERLDLHRPYTNFEDLSARLEGAPFGAAKDYDFAAPAVSLKQ